MLSKQTIIVVILFLIILLGLWYMWSLSKQPKVIETRTFSCPGMESFTFEYPVFKGWKYSEPDKDCAVAVSNPNIQSTLTMRIQVSKEASKSLDGTSTMSSVNPQGIAYLLYPDHEDMVNSSQVWLYLPDEQMKAIISVASIEKSSFPRDLFFQTVINTFRLSV